MIGNESILFGNSTYFPSGQCCTNETAFAGHPSNIYLVFALDECGSIGSLNFKIMKRFVEHITSYFVVSYRATRVAIVTWSTQTTLQFGFNTYINNEGVKKGIKKIKYNQGLCNATGDALYFIRLNLFSQSPSDAKKVLFVLTNGNSTNQTTEAGLLKKDGVEIFTFGIGNSVNYEELVAIASQPTKTHKFWLKKFKDLSTLNHLIGSKSFCCLGSSCGYYATVYDACGRKCTCRRGKLTDCKRVRKNFLDMTDLERCRYIRAVKIASTVEPFKSTYDQLISIHQQLFCDGIHYFLPWHRWYILEYENILCQVDCRVTVPYWDWSLDSNNAFTSDVWNSDLCIYTGLGGNGNPLCVTTGPFATPGWQLTPSAQNACLRRDFTGMMPDCTVVQGVLSTTVSNFDYFLYALKAMLHDNVHFYIGGTMSDLHGASPNAPEFFLHHGFIDKIWGDWQEKGISFKQHEYYGNSTSMPGTIYSPRDVHDLDNQPYCVKVCYQEPTQDCETTFWCPNTSILGG